MTRVDRCLMHLSLRLLLAAAFIHTLAYMIPRITYGLNAELIQMKNPPRAVATLSPALCAELQKIIDERPDLVHEANNSLIRKAGIENNMTALINILTRPIDTGNPRQDLKLALIRSLIRPVGCQFFVCEEEELGITLLTPNEETAPSSLNELFCLAYVCAIRDGELRRYNLRLWELASEDEEQAP